MRPVQLLVRPGTYVGKILINSIPGSSATNTVTIRPDWHYAGTVTLQYSGTAALDNYVVRFSNTSNIRFKKVTLKNIGATYCTEVDFVNNNDNILFDSCTFIGNQSATINPEEYVINQTSDVANKIKNVSIINNTIKYGSIGISLLGSAGNNDSNVIIQNNLIDSFFNMGYKLFIMKYLLSPKIS